MNDSGPVIHGLNARGMYPANLSSVFNKYIAGDGFRLIPMAQVTGT